MAKRAIGAVLILAVLLMAPSCSLEEFLKGLSANVLGPNAENTDAAVAVVDSIKPTTVDDDEAVKNLNYASEYAIRVFGKKKEDEEIWKRYSFAIMSMIRNVYRYSSDRTLEYLTAIKSNLNPDFYQPERIISSSPNFIEQAKQYCEDFESICKMIKDVQ